MASPRFQSTPTAARAELQRLIDEGRAQHAQGRLSQAFERYQSAYAIDPQHPDVLHLLGLAYLGMGQAAIGVAFVRRAVAAQPEAAAFRVNLAKALAAQGQWDEAVAQLEAACTLQPEDAGALALLGQVLQQAGRGREAESRYEAALALKPEQADWHAALARLRHARWALPEAMAAAANAWAASPSLRHTLNLGFASPHTGSTLSAAASASRLESTGPMDAAQLEQACLDRDLLVLDDFLEDPLAFREEALRICRAEAARLDDTNFPGVQTPAQPCGAVMQRVADALGRRVKWDSVDHGALRLSVASDDARADVHVDNPTIENIFGGVLYLSLPEHCRGGTSFYRHRESGWERRPDAATLKARGFASFLDFQKRRLPSNKRLPFAQWQQQRDATWERLFEVPMRFNRLVLFRSDFFHAVTELFGDGFENGRLVQLFHFEAER
jgi:tetratricopeptide (TPR) repeat protein